MIFAFVREVAPAPGFVVARVRGVIFTLIREIARSVPDFCLHAAFRRPAPGERALRLHSSGAETHDGFIKPEIPRRGNSGSVLDLAAHDFDLARI